MAYQHANPPSNGNTGHRRRRTFPKWYRIARLLPGELPGSLHSEYRTCGKQPCRCRSGRREDLHGPYRARRWREEAGRQHKRYVKQAELEAVEAAIERRKARLRQRRAERKRHMRRGKGHGRPAHEWARLRRSEPVPAKPDKLRAILRSLSDSQG